MLFHSLTLSLSLKTLPHSKSSLAHTPEIRVSSSPPRLHIHIIYARIPLLSHALIADASISGDIAEWHFE